MEEDLKIDFQVYPILSQTTVNRYIESYRSSERLRDHILQLSRDSIAQSKSFYKPNFITSTHCSTHNTLKRSTALISSSHSPQRLSQPSQPLPPPNLQVKPLTQISPASNSAPLPNSRPSSPTQTNQHSSTSHQPKSKPPLPPTQLNPSERLTIDQHPTNPPHHLPTHQKHTQVNQPPQPKSQCPPPSHHLTRVIKRLEPTTNATRALPHLSAFKSQSTQATQHLPTPLKPKPDRPVPPHNFTAAGRLPIPSQSTTNLAPKPPRPTSLKNQSPANRLSPQAPTSLRSVPPAVKCSPLTSQNIPHPTSLKTRSLQLHQSSSIHQEPKLALPSSNFKGSPTSNQHPTNPAQSVPQSTSVKRRCSQVDQPTSTISKKLNTNPCPVPKAHQKQIIDFNSLPVLPDQLLKAIQTNVKSWQAQQLVSILHRIILYRKQLLSWDHNASHQPIPIDQVHSALLATLPHLVNHLISAHRKQNPGQVTFRDVFTGPSVQYTIQLFGEGSKTCVALKRDFTSLGLIYFPIIKTLRAYWAIHRKKASWGEFRELYESRAKATPPVEPSQLIEQASNLQKYVQIAANDSVVQITQADSVVAHAKSNVQTVDTLVHLTLHPSWWSSSNPYYYQCPSTAQLFVEANQFEHKTCFYCQEKGHIIRTCPKRIKEIGLMAQYDPTDDEFYDQDDDDEYYSLDDYSESGDDDYGYDDYDYDDYDYDDYDYDDFDYDDYYYDG